MTSSAIDISEAIGDYVIDFGSKIPKASKLKPRDLFGDIAEGAGALVDDAKEVVEDGKEKVNEVVEDGKEVANDVVDAVTGDFDITKDVTFEVKAGTPGEKREIFKDPKGRFSLDCLDCYIDGTWRIEGHIVVKEFRPQELTLSVSPTDFKAKLEVEASVKSDKVPIPLSASKELFAAPIPGVGFAVTGFFKIGPTVSLEVGFKVSVAGEATVRFGIEAGLPGKAIVVANIIDPTKSSATGWEGDH